MPTRCTARRRRTHGGPAPTPSWAYARVALQWAERYYANERELALKMIKELDEAEAAFPQPGKSGPVKIPWPTPDFWYEIEKKADAEEPD